MTGSRRTIFLTGFSGAGKSTVARLLAARTGQSVRDLDTLLVERTGRAIADIFAAAGEMAFRALETEALRQVADEAATQGGLVVATGGGVPTIPANQAIMRETGWIICLDAPPETIYARLQAQLRPDGRGERRPLLDAADPLARIRELWQARREAYARADATISTANRTPEEVADAVARAVGQLECAATGAFRVGEQWFGRDRPFVCIPLVAARADEAVALAEQAAVLAPEALELRADYLANRSPAAIAALLDRLAECGVPILFTNRHADEGGARPQDEEERIVAIEAAVTSGKAALVDIELATPMALRDRVVRASRDRGVPVLMSFHDFVGTPDDETLIDRLTAMQAAGASATKLALMPQQASDAVRLLTLCRDLTSGERGDLRLPLAAMSMGPLGMITRVLGHRAGSALTFAALAAGSGSAPGQLSIDELRACWLAML